MSKSTSRLDVSTEGLARVFWLIFLLMPVPLLVVHFSWMLKREHFHYLPALLIATVVLIWQRWNGMITTPFSSMTKLATVWALLLVYLLGILISSPWIIAFGWTVSIILAFASMGGKAEANLVQLWPLALMILPMPMNLDASLTTWLQLRSSMLSSHILDLIDIPHLLLGNVIELSEGTIFVEQACSGVQSVYTLIFCAALLVVWGRRTIFLIPFYVATAVFWALALNVLRIVLVGWAKFYLHSDWSIGWEHELLGYFCLVLALLCLLSTDRLLRILVFPISSDATSTRAKVPLIDLWNWACESALVAPRSVETRAREPRSVVAFSIIAVCILLLIAQCAMLLRTPDTLPQNNNSFVVLPETIPQTAGSRFNLAGFRTETASRDAPMGANAHIYSGEIRGIPVTIAFTQPYETWHDLVACYQGVGWKLNSKSCDSSGEWDLIEASFVTPKDFHGYIWFSAIDARGEMVDAPERSLFSLWKFNLRSRNVLGKPQAALGIIQLNCESRSPLNTDELLLLREEFITIRNEFRQLILTPHGSAD